jgi:hypothetical protein
MPDERNLEQRIATLEKEVAELKHAAAKPGSGENWFQRVAGSFKNQPEFDEVLRLGREIRQADRPTESS